MARRLPMRILLFIPLCLAASAVEARADASVLPAPVSGEVAAPANQTARMTVAVRVNGHGPFPFIIDTGADRTVVSRELAEELDLPGEGSVTLHDTAGTSRVRTVMIDSLGFGPREVRGLKAATLAATHIGAAGLLGIDSLHDQRVLMDFVRDRIWLEPSEAEPDQDPGAILVRAKRRFGQLILVDAQARGVNVNVILDSGAQSSVGNTALRRLLERRGGLARPIATEVISVTGRRVPAALVPVDALTLGKITVRNLPIAFADLHTFRQFGLAGKPAMLLGMDVLRQFAMVSVDFQRKKVRLILAKER